MFKKIKGGLKRFLGVVVAAVAAVSVSVCASAATTEAGDQMTTMMTDAGNQLTTQFGSLVSTIIPVILGILGTGLVIFGIIQLVKLAKKIFGKVAG